MRSFRAGSVGIVAGRGRRASRKSHFELLEDRLALSVTSGDIESSLAVQNVAASNLTQPTATNMSSVVSSASASPNGVGLTPAQIRTAYGLNALPTAAGGAVLDGTGQTVVIVDAYNDSKLFADLNAFDQQFGITSSGPTLFQQYGAAASFLTVLNQNGQAAPLAPNDPSSPSNSSWELEESLDIEWLHAIAPGAKIVLVEANTTGWADLTAAELTGAQVPGATVLSMSWGITDSGPGVASEESSFDQTLAAVPGLSYVAATGDQGSAALYPATSPNVLAVGGTSLTLNTDNSIQSEIAWSNSSGGFSSLESKPAYQNNVLPANQTKRSTPDVAFDGNPNTGVVVYDSYDNTAATPWSEEGGTSLGTPVWAGIVALANQGRHAAGNSNFNTNSPTELLSAIYSLAQRDFHDITSGANKTFSATSGFDQVTGLGTPVANLLVPDLINYGGAVALSSGSLASGTVGLAYSQSITARGGSGPKTMTYNITAGALPAGISINVSNSELDFVGTPTAAGAASIDVTAEDVNGQMVTQNYSLAINVPAPSVTSVSPAVGPVAGGTTVIINGTNLGAATSVLFGSSAGAIVSDSPNQIIVTSPAGQSGSLDVSVTTASGTSPLTASDQFTYVSAPTVTGVNPSSQLTVGGLITITGTNLLNATAVNFGNVPAIIFSDMQGQIIVIGPAVIGTVDVTVTTAGGTSAVTPADQFISLVPAPTVTLTGNPSAISNQSTATFSFSGTGDADTPTDQLTYQVSLDGSAFVPASSPTVYTNLADGSHTFQVEAIDLDGIASTPASYGWFIDTVVPVSHVSALPFATSLTSFGVSWSGSDAGQSSGINSYSVYVSTDGGAPAVWQTATLQTTATFVAQLGHTYAFYSVATDNAGNVEAFHSTADATITTTVTPWKNPANPLDANGSGAVSPLDALVIINYLNGHGPGSLPATNPTNGPFLDTNGDNSASPIDALVVINFLNSQGLGGGSSSIASGGTQALGSAAPASTTPVPAATILPTVSQEDPAVGIVSAIPITSQSSPPVPSDVANADLTWPVASAPSSPAVPKILSTISSSVGAANSIALSALASEPFSTSNDAQATGLSASIQSTDSAMPPLPSTRSSAAPIGLAAWGRLFSAAVDRRQPGMAPAGSLVLSAIDAAISAFGEDELG